MASVEFITKRIEGKEKAVAKIEKKIERINKAKATNWEKNPYFYSEIDLERAEKELAKEIEALNKYRAELKIAEEKANSRNVKVIVDFLNDWKEKTACYYEEAFAEYLEALEEYYEESRIYCDWFNCGARRKASKEERTEYTRKHREWVKAFRQEWNWITIYEEGNELNRTKLNRDLENEANRKYDFIIERTNAIAGEIKDASNLHIGKDGELNGYIIGERGTAKIQTIGAGGWNIQRYHFRTLVHEMK